MSIAISTHLSRVLKQQKPTRNEVNGMELAERKKKILITGIGILLVYLITLLLFNISKNQIQYPDISAEKYVKNILVIIFTGINSIAILPYIAKMYNKIYEGTIEAQELKKKLVFIIILIILGIFLECGYMKDIQQGILNIAKK